MQKAAIVLALVLTLSACDYEEDAFLDACEEEMRARLRSPSSATFGGVDANGAGADGYSRLPRQQGHVWYAYVDSDNAFGASLRTQFMCVQTVGNPVRVVTDEDGLDLNRVLMEELGR